MDMRMPPDEFYREIDWITNIPEDLCERLLDYVKNSEELQNDIYEWQKKGYGGFQMHEVPDYLREWCVANIPEIDFNVFNVQIQLMPWHECRAHIDIKYDENGSPEIIRESGFNFLLTDDGAITSWYDDKVENVLHSVHYKPKKWYQHQGQVHHRITGIVAPPRVAVTIFKYVRV